MTGVHDPLADLLRTIRIDDRAATCPVIVHVPHASRVIPARSRPSFVVDDGALEHELDRLTDTGTDRIADAAPAASRVQHGLSRFVVDVERFPGAGEEMNAVGMGVLYTHGTDRQEVRRPAEADRRDLLAVHRVYGEAFADLVDRVLAAHGTSVIVDLHSYPASAQPYELHAADRRPELCIGVDPVHTPAALVDAVRRAFAGLEAAVDEPFRGAYVPLRHHRRDARVRSVMLELRRDLYLDDALRPNEAAVARLGGALRALVDGISATSGRHPAG